MFAKTSKNTIPVISDRNAVLALKNVENGLLALKKLEGR